MKSLNALLLGITLLLAAVLAAIWGVASFSGEAPQQARAPGGVDRPAPPLPQAAAAVAASAPPVAAAPVPLPATIVSIASAARQTPMDRPMTRVSKSWLGCQTRQGYADTLALLTRKDPAVAEAFKGDHPACVMLATGEKVTVAFTDQPEHAVQVRLDASGELLWTDPSALDGEQ